MYFCLIFVPFGHYDGTEILPYSYIEAESAVARSHLDA